MTATRPASVRVQALSHRYRGAVRSALHEVSFAVEPGERLGLLGPNGAGKSTLMRLLCGFLPVASAAGTRLEVAGHDVRTDSLRVRQCVGYMPEHVPLYSELRAIEHLRFRARIKRVPWRRRAAEVQRVAGMTGIEHVLQSPVGQLSRGYRQRVGLADALLGAPPLIVLDEPTVGLDPNQVRDVRAMLRELGGEHTLLFSSHILAEVEMLCDRVVILSQGEVAADESIEAATTAGRVHLAVADGASVCQAVVMAAARALGVTWQAGPEPGPGHACWIDVAAAGVAPSDALRALGEAATQAGAVLVTLRAGTTRLEERFAEVTGAVVPHAAPDPEAAW